MLGGIESIMEKTHLGKAYYSTYFLPFSLSYVLYGLIYYYFGFPILGLIFLGFQYLCMEVYFTMFSRSRDALSNGTILNRIIIFNLFVWCILIVASLATQLKIQKDDFGKIQCISLWLNYPVFIYYTVFLHTIRNKYINSLF